ncbi:FAD-binding protein [Actinocorallia sp. A-T 12471]|uniref:FAD-binding protein n=1 Tax=Actinocorallia sp. A-T 12471 TaxID=3089813 RepID=UPI0029D007BC|nr:FAD-binding protein [Actinocorallia sp. A-T 12471]MDX6738363.1 FAD-binding protein [Actinocorallia sp. A-T 12471]
MQEPVSHDLSRRSIMTGLVAGALVVGLDPVSRTWVTAANAAGPFDAVPPLDGTLRTDAASLAAAADDFGHIISRTPLAVLEPGSVADVAKMVKFCRQRGIKVAARGQGHTTHGQAQVAGGLVIETGPLDGVQILADRAVVGGGTTWSALVQASLAQGLTPPTLTDYLGLSVGGTLSNGGLGGQIIHHGAQVDNVLELEVVTGKGDVLRCSPTQRKDLFDAVRSGLGQVGIITEAVVKLAPAPATVRRYNLYYPSVAALTAAQRAMCEDGRFDYLEGQIGIVEGGHTFLMEAVKYDATPADDTALIGDLTHTSVTIDDLTYWDFADRIGPIVDILKAIGEWQRPHPWLDSIVTGSSVNSLVTEALPQLTPDKVGLSAVILLYPIPTAKVKTPLLRLGAARELHEKYAFLFSLLRTSSPGSLDPAAMLALNKSFYNKSRLRGGGWYPVGSNPLTKPEWTLHFGPTYPSLALAKTKYDPTRTLTPGQGIF